MKKLLLLLTLLFVSGCTLNNARIPTNNSNSSTATIHILDQKSISYPLKNNIPFSEISDLTYNKKEKILYMIGDKGYFYKFNVLFKDKIRNIKYLNAYKVNEKKKSSKYDVEGLTQNSKGELYVSFERHPRIARISQKGFILKNQSLPKKLKKKKNYANSNKIFEALAWHPKYGLLTVPEYPLLKKDTSQQTLYSLKGKQWSFKAEKYPNSAVTAIEVMDKNTILILERAFTSVLNPIYITLKKLYLNKCNKKRVCKSQVLATFKGHVGGSVHNYEGLAKVGKNRYVMVSDNNNKSILKTELVYFEVTE